MFHIDVLSFCGPSIRVPCFITILAFLVKTSIFWKFLQRSVLRLKDGFLQRNPQRAVYQRPAGVANPRLLFFLSFLLNLLHCFCFMFWFFFFGHEACGTLAPNQGSKLHFLQWKVKSQPLDPQGSPSPRSL